MAMVMLCRGNLIVIKYCRRCCKRNNKNIPEKCVAKRYLHRSEYELGIRWLRGKSEFHFLPLLSVLDGIASTQNSCLIGTCEYAQIWK